MFLVVSSLCTTKNAGRSGLIKRPSSLIARALLRLTLSAEISRVSLLGTTKGRDLREDTASHWHTRCTSELFGTNWPPKVSSKFEAKRIVVQEKKQLISHSNWIHCIQHIHTTASYSHCQCSRPQCKTRDHFSPATSPRPTGRSPHSHSFPSPTQSGPHRGIGRSDLHLHNVATCQIEMFAAKAWKPSHHQNDAKSSHGFKQNLLARCPRFAKDSVRPSALHMEYFSYVKPEASNASKDMFKIKKKHPKPYGRSISADACHLFCICMLHMLHLDKYAPESLSHMKNGWERLQQLCAGQLLRG